MKRYSKKTKPATTPQERNAHTPKPDTPDRWRQVIGGHISGLRLEVRRALQDIERYRGACPQEVMSDLEGAAATLDLVGALIGLAGEDQDERF